MASLLTRESFIGNAAARLSEHDFSGPRLRRLHVTLDHAHLHARRIAATYLFTRAGLIVFPLLSGAGSVGASSGAAAAVSGFFFFSCEKIGQLAMPLQLDDDGIGQESLDQLPGADSGRVFGCVDAGAGAHRPQLILERLRPRLRLGAVGNVLIRLLWLGSARLPKQSADPGSFAQPTDALSKREYVLFSDG